MKTVLVFGSNGMLGDYFCNMLEQKEYEVIRNDKASGGIDITDEQQVRDLVFETNPEYVVNCAAFTNVDLAEKEKELAFSVNAKAPKYMAKISKELEIPFIHVSTDYIFGENRKEGYTEEYKNFKPLSVYGESKLKGELNVLEENLNSYIFRTSWLFGPNAKNFVNKITELAKERPHLNVVTDEIGCPTYVRDLSEGMFLAIDQKIEPGIYHLCSSDHLSRNEFAKEILRLQNLKTPIYDAKLDDFPREATVPHFSVLLNTKLDEARSSSQMLEEYFKQS
jgi:dTDP-4-dehydrorhamnose reductase